MHKFIAFIQTKLLLLYLKLKGIKDEKAEEYWKANKKFEDKFIKPIADNNRKITKICIKIAIFAIITYVVIVLTYSFIVAFFV